MPGDQGHQAFSIISSGNPTRRERRLGCSRFFGGSPPGQVCQSPRRGKSAGTLGPRGAAHCCVLRVTFICHILIGNHSRPFLFIISRFIYWAFGLSVCIQTYTESYAAISHGTLYLLYLFKYLESLTTWYDFFSKYWHSSHLNYLWHW